MHNIIHLLDGSVVIVLSTGPITITPETYNYNKLVKSFSTATEQQILDLLVSPSYPDGIFRLYTHNNSYHVSHLSTTVNSHYFFDDTIQKFKQLSNPIPYNAYLLGVYTSFDEIFADFPEILL